MQEMTMHGRSGRRPQQQTLTFDRREQWQWFPDPDQRGCRALVGQLLRAVLHAEAATRSDDEREDPSRSS
jgi:hypothetical protein